MKKYVRIWSLTLICCFSNFILNAQEYDLIETTYEDPYIDDYITSYEPSAPFYGVFTGTSYLKVGIVAAGITAAVVTFFAIGTGGSSSAGDGDLLGIHAHS